MRFMSSKIWPVVNGFVAFGAFVAVIGMMFFDYVPSRTTVILAIFIVGVDSINKIVDYRTRYWQERKAEAERESQWLDAYELAKKEGRTLPNERETT